MTKHKRIYKRMGIFAGWRAIFWLMWKSLSSLSLTYIFGFRIEKWKIVIRSCRNIQECFVGFFGLLITQGVCSDTTTTNYRFGQIT